MNQELKMSPKLEKWRKWMKVIEKEIYGLVVDANIFWEVQDIIRENPSIQKPSAFYRYLGRIYLPYALSGLRQQIKPPQDSISLDCLMRLLKILKSCPSTTTVPSCLSLTLKRWISLKPILSNTQMPAERMCASRW